MSHVPQTYRSPLPCWGLEGGSRAQSKTQAPPDRLAAISGSKGDQTPQPSRCKSPWGYGSHGIVYFPSLRVSPCKKPQISLFLSHSSFHEALRMSCPAPFSHLIPAPETFPPSEMHRASWAKSIVCSLHCFLYLPSQMKVQLFPEDTMSLG